jgi:hypothetical protein
MILSPRKDKQQAVAGLRCSKPMRKTSLRRGEERGQGVVVWAQGEGKKSVLR